MLAIIGTAIIWSTAAVGIMCMKKECPNMLGLYIIYAVCISGIITLAIWELNK